MRTFRSLGYKNYALFWSSDILASMGALVRDVALYWYVYEITNSALALAVLGLCEATPRLVLAPFFGVLVDRSERLRLLIFIQFITTVPILLQVILFFLGILEFWHILALEIVHSIIRGINPAASQSLIRDLVPKGEIMNAVALFSVAFNIARVVGPSVGGVLILWIGVGGCFVVHVVSLAISALELLLIRLPKKALGSGGQNFLREVKEGIQYIWHEPVILGSIGAAYILSVFVTTYQRFLPIFAKEILHVGPGGFGVLMSAPGIGAILSLTFLASLSEETRKEIYLWILVAVPPTFLILFCLSGSFPLSVALLACVGAGQAGYRTMARVVIQTEVPHGLMGRTISVFQMDQGLRSVGSMV
ncbi:MAG: MFS transporter, partial [Deltaproteobacteria bacterium]|nr:MFS transporter [Deltaproteobacteria bacterium]